MKGQIRLSAHVLGQENERVKVRLREGTSVQGWGCKKPRIEPDDKQGDANHDVSAPNNELTQGGQRVPDTLKGMV
jgi:hypothetical protein